MNLSSPRFKAFSVSAGLSFWFYVIASTTGLFSIELFVIFLVIVFPVMQLLAIKVSKTLDIFAVYNTKFFLGITFVCLVSLYGLFFKVLRIDLLRLKKQSDTYWLDTEEIKQSDLFKQY